ncbi:MAG: TlpA disulfide reductase family protein [Planctomycetota bacterium]
MSISPARPIACRVASALAVLAAGLFASVASAQNETERARAIFSSAAARLDTYISLSADIELDGSAPGQFDQTTPTGTGKLRMIAIEDNPIKGAGGEQITRIDAMFQRTRRDDPRELSLFGTPYRNLWTDPDREVVVRRLAGRGIAPPAASLASMMMPELHQERPFARELRAESYTFEGQELVGDELCDKIRVVYGDAPSEPKAGLILEQLNVPEAVWYMSVNDRFPRRVDRLGDYDLDRTHIMTSLVWDEAIFEADLELEPPAGWTYDGPRIREGRDTVEQGGAPLPERNPNIVPPSEPAKRLVAPGFRMLDSSGNFFTNAEALGQVSVLYFWGTWCVPCREYSPLVDALIDSFKDEPVGVYAPAIRERDEEAVRGFLAERGYRYELLLGTGNRVGADSVARAFRVRVYPTIVVLTDRGTILATEQAGGGRTAEEVVGSIEATIREYLDNEFEG